MPHGAMRVEWDARDAARAATGADHRRLGRAGRGVRPGLRRARARRGAGRAPAPTGCEALAAELSAAPRRRGPGHPGRPRRFEAHDPVMDARRGARPPRRRAGQQRRLRHRPELRRRAVGAAARLPDDHGGQRLRPRLRRDPRHGRARRRRDHQRRLAGRRSRPASPATRLYPGAKSLMIKFSQSLDAEYRAKGVEGHRASAPASPGPSSPGQDGTQADDGRRAARASCRPPRRWSRAPSAPTSAGRVVVVPGWHNKLAAVLLHDLPEPLVRARSSAPARRSIIWKGRGRA